MKKSCFDPCITLCRSFLWGSFERVLRSVASSSGITHLGSQKARIQTGLNTCGTLSPGDVTSGIDMSFGGSKRSLVAASGCGG